MDEELKPVHDIGVLSYDNLPEFWKGMVNDALAKVAADCINRPNLNKEREVLLKFTISPGNPDDLVQQPEMKFAVKTTMPVEKAPRCRGLVRGGKVMINRSDKDPFQTVIPNVLPMKKENT